MARKASSADERMKILQEVMDEIDRDKGIIPLISPPLIWGKSADLQVTPSFGGLMEWTRWTLDR